MRANAEEVLMTTFKDCGGAPTVQANPGGKPKKQLSITGLKAPVFDGHGGFGGNPGQRISYPDKAGGSSSGSLIPTASDVPRKA